MWYAHLPVIQPQKHLIPLTSRISCPFGFPVSPTRVSLAVMNAQLRAAGGAALALFACTQLPTTTSDEQRPPAAPTAGASSISPSSGGSDSNSDSGSQL